MHSRILGRLSVFPLCLIVLSLCSIASAQQEQKITINGKVIDQNSAAITGALVVAQRGNSSSRPVSVTTNQHGEFSFATEPGSYTLSATAEGFATWAQNLNFKRESAEPLEIVLEVADASATVTITDLTGYLTQAITSATKSATSLRDIPQSISVVSKDQIK